ncbi:hypothetical protein TIFTF001_016609 [Ficus carica]|uniref:Retrotransposon gag domain-containing protein n=1 Tax=Ficus carica TaxID=3494 RepID=A0AA88A6L8_FICCA|nr:hypothetical protein TIFTF001_016609 [Ficus carica]
MEQRFSLQIHRATTSTPGFDNLARGVRETPFTKRITNTITPKFGSISFPRFDGMSDPHDHLLQHKHVVQSMNNPTGMLDDMMCKLFAQSLKGAASRWFCNLPPKSIDSFDELLLEFMRSYSVHVQSGKTTKNLWSVIQGPHESLRAYIKRFSKAIFEISGLDDGTAREALKKGLRHKSLFKNEICARYPPTIQDTMHRAKGYIELEKENEQVERDLARTREEVAKARDEREKTFRRKRIRPVRRTKNREKRTARRDHKRPFSPPKYTLSISPSELIAHLKCQDFVTWPEKLPEYPARDTTKYCEFHKYHGHHTIDCRVLRAEVAELLKKGHLQEFLTEKGRETYGLGNESKERKIVQPIEETPSPPLVRKTIGVICGGSTYSGETVTAIKSHRRKAIQPIATILPDDPTEHSIKFHSNEATSLSRPHDDALVLTLNISNCEIGRILIDNGSSTDVLFLSTLREMELSELDIEKSTIVLTGFNGESTTAVGKIKLPVFAVGENKMTCFLVLDCSSAYNIILGRPWIHAMKAVPSTYHQRIRFPTKQGIRR